MGLKLNNYDHGTLIPSSGVLMGESIAFAVIMSNTWSSTSPLMTALCGFMWFPMLVVLIGNIFSILIHHLAAPLSNNLSNYSKSIVGINMVNMILRVWTYYSSINCLYMEDNPLLDNNGTCTDDSNYLPVRRMNIASCVFIVIPLFTIITIFHRYGEKVNWKCGGGGGGGCKTTTISECCV